MATTIASSSTSHQPNQTLYVYNLNTKTKKPELRRQLYCLFSTYGKVIDVVATRTEKMKGQAFVVFRELSSATAARRALEGFEFYEKSLRIDYAKTRSKASIIQEHGPEALFNPTLLASTSLNIGETSATGASSSKVTVSSAQADQKGREKKRAREEARQRGENVVEDEESEEEDEERETKVRKVDATEEDQGGKATNGDTGTKAVVPSEQEEEEEDEDAMDMGESDSDDDDTPGPPPPP